MTIIIPFLLSSSSFLVKMSITHFYTVLFPHLLLTKLCKAQLLILTLCWLGGGLPYFFMCRPLAFTWDRTLSGEALLAGHECCCAVFRSDARGTAGAGGVGVEV
jgi:hypothetical protein